MRPMIRAVPSLAVLLCLAPHGAPAVAQQVVEPEISTEYQKLRLVRVADGLRHPWAVAFLPGGRMLVSERPGRLLLVDDGRATEVAGLPPVHAHRQGGLLDVVAHPDFARNGWVYFTYSKGDSAATAPALARGRLEGSRLVEVENLFTANRPSAPGRHYGSRIVFLDYGTLLMSVGDRGVTPARAQDRLDHAGSVLRLTEDGGVPADNPFVGDPAYAPEIYSYGHRNVQGLVRHPATGEIWATDHGPRGSDELQRILPGRNYGWPVVSLGREYPTQAPFGEARRRPEFEAPVFEFLPTLAPSGLAAVQGGGFDETWQGNLLAGGLRAERILRLVVEGGEVVHAEELLLRTVGRIRDVRQGPDGHLYVVTDAAEGGVYRLEAAS
jgi:aldose sugar dehydrogenase